MTNQTGSASYMAPEVFASKQYTMKCDVFSWAIVFWEILSRMKPFRGCTRDVHLLWKVWSGTRPFLMKNCPQIIEVLLIRCWEKDPANRPTMEKVETIMIRLFDLLRQMKPEADTFLHIPPKMELHRNDSSCSSHSSQSSSSSVAAAGNSVDSAAFEREDLKTLDDETVSNHRYGKMLDTSAGRCRMAMDMEMICKH